MDKSDYHARIEAPQMRDYGVYLKCDRLLACQKPLSQMVNADELQFQIVHQVEELWMKLIAYTLVDVLDYLERQDTHRIVTLMGRVHRLVRMMTAQLDLLETMSPKEYQQIRLELGNGSGQESPGFKLILRLPPDLWRAFKHSYLDGRGLSVEDVYDAHYDHGDAYVVAEALIEFDELFQKFRANHLYLIHRSIGLGAKSLKGRPVEILEGGARHRFFPELWDIRCDMTDRWGAAYGTVRDSISHPPQAKAG
ncbi:MAG: tryptophan 2,3-dioxygenase [Mesorhizobium sp.]|uniref:tryptophan 2,3-dioxygenase family protein n=1 Tax=unclassified Mesorhizobium TaxID=325217 RepID=UPI000FC9E23B|nr:MULTISPECIES: tryptophan 2,3-dioxygenase family protein [unclassified Mesorhizobium]RUV43794.1 tryptophan 2,3-dioxygenase [Mesorhizobium sp. M1A.T.Ca.IN.004.03.1.1]RWG11523.1 MAG: tryptophan 2,3-dioxygenase [Mesorhizobium sp.]RWI88593.1 MAG: tryptophan 2,3-dioxygenase [Mesorhizobium sp.]RWK32509.1 MAG: tryptophan 2,3-dioxygenase [Mesorhizobium sp.]RWK85633.1 MAG: tryptophan 2,3-dioxygenase [Mesorhizobium sp.]